MTGTDIDPLLKERLDRAIDPLVPGPAAEARIGKALQDSGVAVVERPRRRLAFWSPLRALMVATLTAALVAATAFGISYALRARELPRVSGPASKTPPAITPPVAPTTSTAQPIATSSPALASWIARLIPIGWVGAIALSPSAVYVIYEKSPVSGGGFDPAVAHVARIDRSSYAVRDGGLFPGAQSLAFAAGYLWVASGPSPGVSHSAENVLYRLDASSLAVQRHTSLASLGSNASGEPPSLAGSGGLLWVGYGNHVTRLDPTTSAVMHMWTIRSPAAGVSSLSMDPAGTRLYVGMVPSGVSIAELDSATGRTLATTSAYYGGDLGGPRLAATADGVWVAYATGTQGTAVGLRASDLRRIATIPGQHGNAIDAFSGSGVLWTIDVGTGELVCASPPTGATRASVSWTDGGLLVADSSGTYVGGNTRGVFVLRPSPVCHAG